MNELIEVGREGLLGYWRYFGRALLHHGWGNYLTLLLVLSAGVWLWELRSPWRREQKAIREGFFLDAFYMFFNFFGFSLVGYAAIDAMVRHGAEGLFAKVGLNIGSIDVSAWPSIAKLLLFFVLRDLIHYWVHRALHRWPVLWRFHQVHHSVRQMGFAAHLRFHFAETLIYRSAEFLPLAMIGFGAQDFFVAHGVAVLIGHWNHANVRVPLGPFRYLLNSPQMHIFHHAKELPGERLASHGGVNFGISLSVWDYLFGTAWFPKGSQSDGADEVLGFEGIENYPQGFWGQLVAPFRRKAEWPRRR